MCVCVCVHAVLSDCETGHADSRWLARWWRADRRRRAAVGGRFASFATYIRHKGRDVHRGEQPKQERVRNKEWSEWDLLHIYWGFIGKKLKNKKPTQYFNPPPVKSKTQLRSKQHLNLYVTSISAKNWAIFNWICTAGLGGPLWWEPVVAQNISNLRKRSNLMELNLLLWKLFSVKIRSTAEKQILTQKNLKCVVSTNYNDHDTLLILLRIHGYINDMYVWLWLCRIGVEKKIKNQCCHLAVGCFKGAAGISHRQSVVWGSDTQVLGAKFDAQWYWKLPHVFSIFY